jgi:hypothetical protein
MKRALILGLALAIGCSDGRDPIRAAPLEGTYELTAIDGNPLPQNVVIDGQTRSVLSGSLEFGVANVISVGLTHQSTTGLDARNVAVSGQYRRVTADSVVFPVIAQPELFVRRTASTVTVVTQPAGGMPGPASFLGGAHRLTFEPV